MFSLRSEPLEEEEEDEEDGMVVEDAELYVVYCNNWLLGIPVSFN